MRCFEATCFGSRHCSSSQVELQPGLADDLRERAMRRKLIDGIIAEAEIEDVPHEQYDEAAQEREEQAAGEPAERAEEEPAEVTDEQEEEAQ